jgi:spermidine synthase
VGLALGSRGQADATRIGVIGLGVGTLAAYGRTGDLMRFYEIDPAVIRIARDSGDFTYLKDSTAKIEVVLGDARVALAEEQARGAQQDFDVLVVDAFNSDAVPIHLLTRQAFEHYAAALAPDGLLAIHVSSRHFDLLPLVARMGLEVGLSSVRVETDAAPLHLSRSARWALLTRNREQLGELERELERRHRALGLPPASIVTAQTRRWDVMDVPVWTDDYSDLFSLLIRKW